MQRTKCRESAPWHHAVWLDAMLEAIQLPTWVADLNPGLADVYADDLPHFFEFTVVGFRSEISDSLGFVLVQIQIGTLIGTAGDKILSRSHEQFIYYRLSRRGEETQLKEISVPQEPPAYGGRPAFSWPHRMWNLNNGITPLPSVWSQPSDLINWLAKKNIWPV